MSEEQSNDSNMSLVDHLSELRVRLVYSAYAVAIGTIISYVFSSKVLVIIRKPIEPYLPSGGLVFTAPLDLFIGHLKISLLCGAILSCPIWIYQIWCFVAPGLYRKEKTYATSFIVTGSFLFLCGISFAYFIVYPTAFHFLLTFGDGTNTPMITINEYLSFFTTTTLVFGLAFEMPLILVLLGIIGVIDQKFLRSKRRYAIVAMAVIAAIVTPPDALSMLMLLIPLCLLYEVAAVAVGFFEKKRADKQI